MRMLLLAVLAATALSGCLADEPTDDADITTGTLPNDPVQEDVVFQDTLTIVAGTDSLDAGCGSQGTVDRAETTWTIAPVGNSSRVSDLRVTISWLPSIVDADVVLYGPDGGELGRANALSAGEDSETLEVEGSHAPGDYRIVVLGCVGGGDVTVDATAVLNYVPA